jgi:anti-sigma28 factor (negative regulator of flagellin synthesis)
MGHSDKGDRPVPLPAAGDNPEGGAQQLSESGVKAQADNANSVADAERQKKINDLKQAVADGTYHVSAEEVARKIIDHMLQPKE